MKLHSIKLTSVLMMMSTVTLIWSCKKEQPQEELKWEPQYQSFKQKSMDITVDKNTTKIPIEIDYIRGIGIRNNFALNLITYPVAELTTAIENEHFTLKWIPEYVPTNPEYPKPLYRPYILPYNDKYTANTQTYELLIDGSKITDPISIGIYCPQFKCWENPNDLQYIDTLTIHIKPSR